MQRGIVLIATKLRLALPVSAIILSTVYAQSIGHPDDRLNDQHLQQRVDAEVEKYQQWSSRLLNDSQSIRQLKRDSQSSEALRFGSEAWSARNTLARLGDRRAIEEIICEGYDKRPSVRSEAIRSLEEVGGYTSIKALSDILLSDPPLKVTGDRSMDGPLRREAMSSLWKLVPEMPIPVLTWFIEVPTDQQVREWYDWIITHRDQLGRLLPNETVELDGAKCEEHKKMKHSSVKSAKRP
jgi:hypothetical protein